MFKKVEGIYVFLRIKLTEWGKVCRDVGYNRVHILFIYNILFN
jgi:hypothetical protein